MIALYLAPKDSLQQAINSLPPYEEAVIYLAPGLWREKVIVDRGNLKIVGHGAGKSVISYDDYAEKIHPDGLAYNTFRTYTMNIISPNVTLSRLTVENTAGDPKHKGQSVALSCYADNITVEDCTLSSTQDTLFCGPLPDDLIVRYIDFLPKRERYLEGNAHQHFSYCRIEGSVDFIFGCGQADFTDCTIHSVYDGREESYIAAPAHSLKQREGFSFTRCTFTGDAALERKVYLARPWREFGKCEFVDCQLGPHIHVDGFDPWNDTRRDRTARFFYSGLGSRSEGFVPWAVCLGGKEPTCP